MTGLRYTSGRAEWLSRDPLPDAEQTQGPNLYEYVQNDPIDNSDPMGLGSNGASTVRNLAANPVTYSLCPCGQHLAFIPEIFHNAKAEMGVNDATTIAAGAGFVGAMRVGAGILSPYAKAAAGYIAAVNIGSALGSFRCVSN
jgi:uncharacterized protein RhaS with RHS repeats